MATNTRRPPVRTPVYGPDHERVPIDAGVETWRNTLAGKVVINRVGEYGRRIADIVHGGRTFQITPQERRMNQSAAASADQDLFTNGTLAPVTLIDGEPDTEFLRTNPNALSEEDLPKLFQLTIAEFTDRIGKITASTPIGRLIELARDPSYNATLAQYEALKARDIELQGALDEKPPVELSPDGVPRGVTPR